MSHRTITPVPVTESSERIRAIARDEAGKATETHKGSCEAVRGYQRVVGALAVLTLLFTFVVWLGKASLRSEIADIVSKELEKRIPTVHHVKPSERNQSIVLVAP
jgi:hypothetical protein